MDRTDKLLKTLKPRAVELSSIATDMFVPNLSGDITVSHIQEVKTKEYIDGVTSKLIPNRFDDIILTPNKDSPTTIVYKLNGSIVGTLTLTYDVDGNVLTISNGSKTVTLTYPSATEITITES